MVSAPSTCADVPGHPNGRHEPTADRNSVRGLCYPRDARPLEGALHQSVEGVPSIELEARSADLGIKHRDIDARQQRFLALSLTPFRKYTVFRPERLEEFLVDGLVKRVDSARGVPSNELKEFDIYLYGKQALLMNPRRTHVCLDKATGVDWPNPFIRCESVIDGYAARFEVSAEALVQLSAVLRLVDQLTLRLTPCMNSARNMNHG